MHWDRFEDRLGQGRRVSLVGARQDAGLMADAWQNCQLFDRSDASVLADLAVPWDSTGT
jgi:hypothetical protein